MGIYKKLFGYAPEKAGFGFAAVVLSAVSSVILMLPFWYLWKFLFALSVHGDTSEARFYALRITALLIANICVYFAGVMCSHILAFRLESNLRKEGTKHLMNASFSFFDTNSSGKVRKLIDDNAAQTHMIVAHLLPDITGTILTPILMFGVVFAVDVQLGILLSAISLIALVLMRTMFGDRNFMSAYMKSLDVLNAEAVEYVRGMQVIKIFRTTIDSYKTFYNSIKEYSRMVFRYSMSCRRGYVLFQIILNLFVTFTIPFAIVYMNKGESDAVILAKIIFFACFAGILFMAFMKTMYVGMYQFQAKTVVEQLEGLFKSMEEKKLVRGGETEFSNYNIEFKDVSFKYEDTFVIRDLSFALDEGKTYALVGSSGGGKSTIAKLISGFYSIDGGHILIGGKDITSYTEEALTKNVAFVFQNAKLFSASIFENVKIAKPDATDEEVMEALRLAQCGDILNKFKEREHTLIGSHGVHLSGGEIQRIAIARVILKNAKVVILDEASAAADPENEFEIQKAFSNLMKGKTVIMIAHRLSSIRGADEILVIENGRIIERGSDGELMAAGGKYKALQDLYAKANDWRVA